jgi:hypothetical protein
VYNTLLTLQAELLTVMKDGVTARDVYQHAISFIRDKKPDLEKNFVKNIGFGVCQLDIFISAYADSIRRWVSNSVILLIFYQQRMPASSKRTWSSTLHLVFRTLMREEARSMCPSK